MYHTYLGKLNYGTICYISLTYVNYGMGYFFRRFILNNKHQCSVAIQVLPISKSDSDKIRIDIISKIIEYIKSTGLSYSVGAFETTIEGDLNTLIKVIEKCQTLSVEMGADSVMSYIKIFYNPNGVLSIEEKTAKYN